MRCIVTSLVLLAILNLSLHAQTTTTISNDRTGQTYKLEFNGSGETGNLGMETTNSDMEDRHVEMAHSYDPATKTDTWTGIWDGSTSLYEFYTITKNRETGKWTIKLVTEDLDGVIDPANSYDDSATKIPTE